ncbi:MAG: tripartite tricarboxylate transporter substrate binding protein [Anaerolineales bacterium]
MRLRDGRLVAALAAGLAVVAALAGPATAQPYPERRVEIVVPFGPGGGTDQIARATANYLAKKWGQPLLVVNKPGGGGVIGARAALKGARPDGYTVLMDIVTTSSLLIGAWKSPPLTLADRKWAGRIVFDPIVFAVKADAPWKDLEDLSAWVKARPEQLVWSGGSGPSAAARYTALEWFAQIGVDPARTKMVSTEGAAESMTKLAGGHVALTLHALAESRAMVEGRKVRLLAVLAPRRVSYIPSIPTAEEQGVMKGVSVSWWAGISMPATTPDAVVRKWEGALAEMVKDPAFRARTDRLWMNLDYLTAAEMTAFVKEQAAYYTDLAGKIGIRK